MFTVELYAGIRRAVMVDGLSRREAARRFGVHRNTISKMLRFSVLQVYRCSERPASKKLGPYIVWIDKVLADDKSVHVPYYGCAYTFMPAICIAATVIFWL